MLRKHPEARAWLRGDLGHECSRGSGQTWVQQRKKAGESGPLKMLPWDHTLWVCSGAEQGCDEQQCQSREKH